MQLGYTIIYVPNVEAALLFYEKAFGLKRKFLCESKQYGELDTGSTLLAFATESVAHDNGYKIVPNRVETPPAGFEIAFTTKDIHKAYQNALVSGAQGIKEPHAKPWGQTVAYLRDLNGVLVELCTPMQY